MTPEMKISLVALLVFLICVGIILLPKKRRRKPGHDGADASGIWFWGSGHHNRDNDHGGGFDGGGDGGGGD